MIKNLLFCEKCMRKYIFKFIYQIIAVFTFVIIAISLNMVNIMEVLGQNKHIEQSIPIEIKSNDLISMQGVVLGAFGLLMGVVSFFIKTTFHKIHNEINVIKENINELKTKISEIDKNLLVNKTNDEHKDKKDIEQDARLKEKETIDNKQSELLTKLVHKVDNLESVINKING